VNLAGSGTSDAAILDVLEQQVSFPEAMLRWMRTELLDERPGLYERVHRIIWNRAVSV
jgi:hypothetical protein